MTTKTVTSTSPDIWIGSRVVAHQAETETNVTNPGTPKSRRGPSRDREPESRNGKDQDPDGKHLGSTKGRFSVHFEASGSWSGCRFFCSLGFWVGALLSCLFESQLGDSTKFGQSRSSRERQLGGSTKLGLPKGLAEKLRPSPPAAGTASPEDSPTPKGARFGGGCQT